MNLHTEPLPGDPTLRAAMYGPLVLAADLGPGPKDGPLKFGAYDTGPKPAELGPAAAAPTAPAGDAANWIDIVSAKDLAFQIEGRPFRKADVPHHGREVRRLLGNGEEGLSDPEIKTISSREVYRNKWTRVREDVIERANGQRGIYGVVDKDPSCIIIPLDTSAEGEFLYFVEQYRYTVGARFMEFPQGSWEGIDATPEDLARGELREETGLAAERMTLLGALQIGYGVINQQQHVFLAEGLRRASTNAMRRRADLEVHRVSVAELRSDAPRWQHRR